jgi:hemerythrin-like domain-containing protein
MANKANARHRALGLIKDEHRSLAAVVHALQYLARQMSEGKEPNQTLLGAIAHYLLQFPEKLHHPAEDKYLFAPLRARTSESKDVLDKLEAEHAAGDDRAAKLSAALNELAARSTGSIGHFNQAVEEYANFYWAHMMCEETLILPLAERVLNEEEWGAAANGFAANHDPLYGTDTANEFDALFKRIVYMAPAPIGLGG